MLSTTNSVDQPSKEIVVKNKFDKVKFLQKVGLLNARFGPNIEFLLIFSFIIRDSNPQVQLRNAAIREKLASSLEVLLGHFDQSHDCEGRVELPIRTKRCNSACYWFNVQFFRPESQVLRELRSYRSRVSSLRKFFLKSAPKWSYELSEIVLSRFFSPEHGALGSITCFAI